MKLPSHRPYARKQRLPREPTGRIAGLLAGTLLLAAAPGAGGATPAAPPAVSQTAIPSPAGYFGHQIGADRKLVGWDRLVEYLRLVAAASPRVAVREIGPTTAGRPFVLVEVAGKSTMAELATYRALERRLYFQDQRPGEDPDRVHTAAERRAIFDRGKAVVLITCTIHSTEVGAAQMSLELVHHLATDDGPQTRQILDNVILLLVPSLNPDGQAMVADWYDQHVGSEFEAGPMPWLYHPYVGHDDNRDMYMYSQVETQWIGEVLYKDWFPAIWLDEHQMGPTGPRIFTMPATDPINLNVHPVIYSLNGVYGQAQAAALEAAGKTGIIYNYTYTNFWEGAMAWTGWWHNQVGLLTEVASVRIATPTEQRLATLGAAPAGPPPDRREARRRIAENPTAPLPPPRDVQPRTTYPRPWLGGAWTLRDIVDYELIASLGLLQTAASTRRQVLEQIYDVNRTTIAQFAKGPAPAGGGTADTDGGYPPLPAGIRSERPATGRVMAGAAGAAGSPYAVIVPAGQHDPPTVSKMLRILERGGVVVERARSSFTADGRTYPAGTWVVRLAQVFGRYAKDMLELQTYPDVRLAPSLPPQPPYDVTAWSLGMQMGVETVFVDQPFEADLDVVDGVPLPEGRVAGRGGRFVIDAAYNDAFKAVNRLVRAGARIHRATASFDAGAAGTASRMAPGSWVIEDASREEMMALAGELGLVVDAVDGVPPVPMVAVTAPRLAVYQPWGSNRDEGWTRWLLERYGFDYTTLHPQDLRAAGTGDADDFRIPSSDRADWPRHVAGHAPPRVVATPLADRFDVILLTHQGRDAIVEGSHVPNLPPVYRGGIGEEGIAALRAFVRAGGTLVAMGDATRFVIAHWPVPVRNVVDDLDQDEFLIPGSILNIQTDPTDPVAWGMPDAGHGYFIRSPVFTITDGFPSQTVTVPVRYPNDDLNASGWTRGAERISGRAAVVRVELAGGGRLILLGLRPQHRVQTHATFKLLFNALMMGTTEVAGGTGG